MLIELFVISSTEANYAFKLKKPIIPVKMEEGYEADGWLGIITGMNKYTEAYSDEMMESNFTQLLKELETVEMKV